MYFLSGIEKLPKLAKVADGLRKRTFPDMPLAPFVVAVTCSSLLITVCPPVVVYASTLPYGDPKRMWGVYAAYALVAFTVVATLVYHFPPTGATYYPFISNVTAVGGLMLVAWVLRK
nr:hypothetical protein TetV2_00639 [Oceanusvirus sp.]